MNRPRVVLLNPRSPEQLGAPLLGQQYVAAALVRHGCDVKVIDAAARYFGESDDWIIASPKAAENLARLAREAQKPR